jgi:Bacterial regulatory protein, Fis family
MDACEPNPSGTYHERLLAFRRALIRDTIVAAGGNRSRAARVLGLQRTYLLRLVRDLDLREALGGGGRSPRSSPSRPGAPATKSLASHEVGHTTRCAAIAAGPMPRPTLQEPLLTRRGDPSPLGSTAKRRGDRKGVRSGDSAERSQPYIRSRLCTRHDRPAQRQRDLRPTSPRSPLPSVPR